VRRASVGLNGGPALGNGPRIPASHLGSSSPEDQGEILTYVPFLDPFLIGFCLGQALTFLNC
jgi:hypothetical protein